MNRIDRDFNARPDSEREFMVENCWCDTCEEADLGMDAPLEYEEDGTIFVEGTCRKCGGRVWSVITEKDVD